MKQPPVTILMVEDDEGHAILLERELRKAGVGYPITRFCDGQEVIDFFEGNRPGRAAGESYRYIMLLDIRMPKVDGIGVLEYLREDELLKLLPVIMLTTAGNTSEVERCHRGGCNAYVVKPVKFTSFVETVRHLGKFIQTFEVPELKIPEPTR